ncbi:RICIN domain-containing protein [Streptomyces sp. NPDC002920]
MQSPNPPRPPYPPRPGWSPGDSDPHLAARLAEGDASGRAVALLLARHWRATQDYAAVCLVGTDDSARLVAAAAFHQVLGRIADGHTGGALRPRLLVAVRNTVREWAGAEGLSAILPELGKTVGGRGLRAARSGTSERRQLAERAFQFLPGASQCLLWHTEVEAEHISVPAGLLGVDGMTATAGLEQAREQFRAGCVRAHRELAPSPECRFYNRLLDVPLRRGGTLLPDVRQHLAHCRFCRHSAEQLSYFDGALDVLLAETVLGWGARRYLDSRPGRALAGDRQAGRPGRSGRADRPDPARPTGRHRTTAAGLLDLPGRRPKAVLVGVGLTSLALLGTVLVAKGWTDDNSVPAPAATWGAPAGGASTSGADAAGDPGHTLGEGGAGRRVPGDAGSAPSGVSSATGPAAVAEGRLRSTGTGRCLDAAGGRAESGAAAVLAVCSSDASQQWSYQEDGLLRSAADPTLCLTVDPVRRTALLAGCVAHPGEAFFDLTVRGELLLRRDGGQVVAPGTGKARTKAVVVKRDGSEEQRWLFDTDDAKNSRDPGRPAPVEPPPPSRSAPPPSHGEAPPPHRDSLPAPDRPAPDASQSEAPGPEFEPRVAQVGCCDTPEPDSDPAAPAAPPLAPAEVVEGVVGGVLGKVVSTLGG